MENTKTSKKSKPRNSIKFCPFAKNKRLCFYHHIDLYKERTKNIIKKSHIDSLIEPHEVISTSTVSRWIIEVLGLTGIGTKTFTVHSTRSASSSKAEILGIPTKEILKSSHWSKATTFEKFYHKEILKDNKKFQDSVFAKLRRKVTPAKTSGFSWARAYHQY